MVVRDAGCSLLLFQAPESEGWAQLLAAGGLSVWQRSSRKHTANRRRARTDTVGAGAVGSVQQVGSRARADAALRLMEGGTVQRLCPACQGRSAIALSGGALGRDQARRSAQQHYPAQERGRGKSSTETKPTRVEFTAKIFRSAL